MPHPGGRPTKFKPEFVKQAAKACQMGATDADLADLFDVSIQTIWNWKSQFREFLDVINKVEKEHADSRVQRSLYQRAVGYSYDAVKIFNDPRGVVEVQYREHVPPDVAAGFIWLKNRRRTEWQDRRDHTFANPDGTNVENKTVIILPPNDRD